MDVKNCCRVCGRTVDHKSRKALFTAIGIRDRIAERLSLLSASKELNVCKDDLSGFVCKKCVSKLDKLTRVEVEAQKLRTDLTKDLIATTHRHRSILRWAASSRRLASRDPPGNAENAKSICHPGSTEGVGDSSSHVLKHALSSTPQTASKRQAPLTPLSANKPESKRARHYQSPLTSLAMGSPLPQSRQRCSARVALPRAVTAARALFQDDSTSSSGEEPQGDQVQKCNSPVEVKVIIGYTKPFTATLDEKSAAIGKSLARKRFKAVAKAVLRHPQLNQVIVQEIANKLRNECANLGSTKNPSILRKKSRSDIVNFNWNAVVSEWENRAPTLLLLLTAACDKYWSRTQNTLSPYCVPALCMAGAILIKCRNKHMSGVQTVISVLLNAGHASSQTYTRLNKLGICLSHMQVLRVVDRFGKGYDHLPKMWKDAVEKKHGTVFPAATSDPLQDSSSLTATSVHLGLDITPSSQVGRGSQDSDSNASTVDDQPTQPLDLKPWKFVGDNLDVTVKVRDMRMDKPNETHHFFHVIAVQDRIDTSQLATTAPRVEVGSLDIHDFVPSGSNLRRLKDDLTILVSRIIVREFPEFHFMRGAVPEHITHIHSKEMAQRSTVVPLGVILKNENSNGDMIEIMEAVHQYVPCHADPSVVLDGIQKKDVVEQCLLGGDLLTCERVRGAKRHRQDAATMVERLEGLEPVSEDWHAKMCLFEVVFHRYFHGASVINAGTLWNLRCLIKRHNISKKVSQEMNELEDFFHSVAKAHVMAAALLHFGMANKEGKPTKHVWHPTLPMTTSPQLHWIYLSKVIGLFVEEFVMPSFAFSVRTKDKVPDSKYSVQNYARSFMADLLFIEEFKDAVHEGDGDRMSMIWKFLLLYFRSTRHPKYAYEAVNLIAQSSALLSERQAYRLKWCRFVNTSGKPGRNISCDLANEHWNRAFKGHLGTAGGNVNSSTILRTGTALSTLQDVCSAYDTAVGITPVTTKHCTRDATKDEDRMLSTLQKHKVFESNSNHSTFPTFSRNHFNRIDRKRFVTWIEGHISKYAKACSSQQRLASAVAHTADSPQWSTQDVTQQIILELNEAWDEL